MTKEKTLKSFNDLDLTELRRAAVEDLAVDIRENASKDEILAEFLELGITWKMYADQHPELAEEEDPGRDQEPNRGNVISAASMKPDVVVPLAEVGVQEPPEFTKAKRYIVKMERDNVLFDNQGYRFTQEHPYAIVDAKDVDAVLEEYGFRLAKPSEADEFYS